MTFGTLFEPAPFIQALRMLNISASANASAVTHGGARVVSAGSDTTGWKYWKHHRTANMAAMASLGRPLELAEQAVLRGLRPAATLRGKIERMKARLMHDGRPYGCLHARIETDMRLSWHLNRAGMPPSLKQYMDAMMVTPALQDVARIFV